MASPPKADPWQRLSRFTPARIALGRTGGSLPTRATLEFALAHARARDAVHLPLDAAAVTAGLERLGLEVVRVESAATERAVYLRRPDLGRRLSDAGRKQLTSRPRESCDLALVIGDGLSAAAVHAHAVALVGALLPRLKALRVLVAPVAIATGARVALGDEIGGLFQARMVAVLIGERPGLSAPDSLGAYLTWAPKPGRTDAERNCLSNIHGGGLSHDLAAFKLSWLIREAFAKSLTGVALKDDSDRLLAGASPPPLLQPPAGGPKP